MQEEIIMAGFGGQGIMFAGTLLAHAAMIEDKFVTFFPSYGAEMRGGTTNCSVIISGTEIGSPIVVHPTTLIVLNKLSLDRFASKLKNNGLLILNSSLVEEEVKLNGAKVIEVPATELAEKLGNVRVANLVALGVYISQTKVISLTTALNSLKDILKANRKSFLEINQQALRTGFERKW